MKNCDTPPAKLCVVEALKLDLKALPSHLRYVLFDKNCTLRVIIVDDLSDVQVEALVSVLKRFKRAIRSSIVAIFVIIPGIILIQSNSCRH